MMKRAMSHITSDISENAIMVEAVWFTGETNWIVSRIACMITMSGTLPV